MSNTNLNKISEISEKIIRMEELGLNTSALQEMLKRAMQEPAEPEGGQEEIPEKKPGVDYCHSFKSGSKSTVHCKNSVWNLFCHDSDTDHSSASWRNASV